jgi:hypothetical protein
MSLSSPPWRRRRSPALVLAPETGQRQGDLLVLPWSAYDGASVRLKQSKTERPVNIPVTHRLRAVLETTPRVSPVILTSSAGRPWEPGAFRNAWGDGGHAGIEPGVRGFAVRCVTLRHEPICSGQCIRGATPPIATPSCTIYVY